MQSIKALYFTFFKPKHVDSTYLLFLLVKVTNWKAYGGSLATCALVLKKTVK